MPLAIRQFNDDAMRRIVETVRRDESRPRRPRDYRRRYPIGGGSGYKFRCFELKTDLVAGGAADAYPRAYDGVAGDDVTDLAGTPFSVRDMIGDRSGTGRDNVSTTSSHGWYGVAMKFPGENVWRVLDLQCPAT